jgi:hypothetical protein
VCIACNSMSTFNCFGFLALSLSCEQVTDGRPAIKSLPVHETRLSGFGTFALVTALNSLDLQYQVLEILSLRALRVPLLRRA